MRHDMKHILLAGIFTACVASAQQAPPPIQDLQVLRLWASAAPGAQGTGETDIPQMTAYRVSCLFPYGEAANRRDLRRRTRRRLASEVPQQLLRRGEGRRLAYWPVAKL